MFTASLKDTEIEKYGLVPHKIAIDGISNLRASLYYKALRKFGKTAASPQNKKIIHRAPEAYNPNK